MPASAQCVPPSLRRAVRAAKRAIIAKPTKRTPLALVPPVAHPGRTSLAAYHLAVNPGWDLPQHQQQICEALERLEQTPRGRLIITMPPRHGKSETVTRSGVGWMLARGHVADGPVKRAAIISYGEQFAAQWTAASRDDFRGDGFGLNVFPELRLATELEAQWRFDGVPATRPTCVAAGVGGQLTGRGFDLLVFDDVVKNAEEALSPTYRERHKRFFRTTARSRLQAGGRIVVIMTRWHEDDLAGWLLKTQPGKWEVLHLKALDETLTQPLWPSGMPLDELLDIRGDDPASVRNFDTQYQGEPCPEDGDKWHREWFDSHTVTLADVPQIAHTVTCYDCAAKTGQANDYSAWVRSGYDPLTRRVYLLDWDQRKLTFPALKRQAVGGALGSPANEIAVVEDTSNGIALVQALQESRERLVLPMSVTTDKGARAAAVSGMLEAGQVLIPRDHPRYESLVSNCVHFPHGEHDDLHDAFVLSLTYWQGRLNSTQAQPEVVSW